MKNKYTLKDLRKDLYLEDEETFKEVFHKETFELAIEKINNDNTLIPVLESDLQREIDFLDECNEALFEIENVNGIVLYRKFKKMKLQDFKHKCCWWLDDVTFCLEFELNENQQKEFDFHNNLLVEIWLDENNSIYYLEYDEDDMFPVNQMFDYKENHKLVLDILNKELEKEK